MKKKAGWIGVALIFGVVIYTAVVELVCDIQKNSCIDFSINHPLIGLLLMLGAILAAIGLLPINPD
jgi:hypothetical protein